MNKLNKGLENFIDEAVIERIEEGIRKAEEEKKFHIPKLRTELF